MKEKELIRSGLKEKDWKEINKQIKEAHIGTSFGPPRRITRKTLEGVVWVFQKKASWRDVPAKYGKWNSVWKAYLRWKKDGRLKIIIGYLEEQGIL